MRRRGNTTLAADHSGDRRPWMRSSRVKKIFQNVSLSMKLVKLFLFLSLFLVFACEKEHNPTIPENEFIEVPIILHGMDISYAPLMRSGLDIIEYGLQVFTIQEQQETPYAWAVFMEGKLPSTKIKLKKGIYEYYSLEEKNNYKFIATDFIEKIDSTYSLISIENPNNPTGQIIDINDIEKAVRKAKQYNIMVIVDEAYGDYMPLDNSAIKLVGKYNNIMVLRSASKFYGLPNHRVGYMFADKELVKIYNEIAIPFPFSDLSASVFIKVLKDYNKLEFTKQKKMEVNQKI